MRSPGSAGERTVAGVNAAGVMTRSVRTVESSTTVRAASAVLVDHGFSTLPVMGQEGPLVGIVAGSDLLPANLEQVLLPPSGSR